MTSLRVWLIGAALVLLAVAASVWIERHPSVTPEMAAAAKRDTVLVHEAAQQETVYVAAKVAASAATVIYRTTRDSVLLHLTDTLLVKETIARADTVIAKDSAALARADTVVAAEKKVTAAVREELAIAMRPHPAARLQTSLGGLWEPLTGMYSASAQVSARVIGSLSLVARADQRGTDPTRLGVGASYTF